MTNIQQLNCPICNSNKLSIKFQNYQGCVENTYFDIINCDDCESRFIDPALVKPELYDIIYGNKGGGGYERYFDVIKEIKESNNPLKTLSEIETTYLPLYQHLLQVKSNQNPQTYSILEVGCGYGYTTYGVKQMGFDITGIDLSTEAIKVANDNFGDYYKICQLQDLPDDSKFDFIFANEVIEHLDNVEIFMKNIVSHLKPGGTIHLTTPNKDYALDIKPDAIWETILPPHHTMWISEDGMSKLANRFNLSYKEFDFGLSSGRQENRFNEARRLLNNNIPTPQIFLSEEVKYDKQSQSDLKKLFHILMNNIVIQLLSTIILKYIWQKPRYKTMGIFLK